MGYNCKAVVSEKLKIWQTKVGFSLKIHKLEKKAIFKEEHCSTQQRDLIE
uniref:Uncharacterized protein n=1 Tax=Solanum tuberosum TaxID=4113 RepID=M1AKL3_SOLTU